MFVWVFFFVCFFQAIYVLLKDLEMGIFQILCQTSLFIVTIEEDSSKLSCYQNCRGEATWALWPCGKLYFSSGCMLNTSVLDLTS